MNRLLPLILILAACSGSPSGPSPNPTPQTSWVVTTDTTAIGGSPTAKTVVLATTAADSSGKATLTFSCSYSFGDDIANGLPISRHLTFRVLDRQLPVAALIVTGWRPSGGPSAFWQVGPTRIGAGVDEADRAAIWAAVPGHAGLRLWWSDGGIVDRPFDIRALGAALADIDNRCHR